MLRTNGARSRLGCLSCRRRKKKCDEVKPTCTACLRNDLRCVWPDLNPSTRNLAAGSTLQQQRAPNATALVPASNAWALAPSSAHRNLPIATIPASPSPFVIPGSVLSGSETWRLLDHYLKDTANRLACLQDSANPFLNTLLPVALGDELLMNSILALSGVHLMQRLPELNSELQSLTWSSYTQALKQLRIALSTAFGQGSSVDAAWRALLVVLIFYLLESLLLPIYISITLPSRHSQQIAPPTPIMLPGSWTNNPSAPSPEIGVLCGCAYELFILAPRVSSLLWEESSQASSPASSKLDLLQQYHDLRTQIEEWKPRSDQQELILCAELYQQSLLLLLDFRFAGENAEDCIDKAFQGLESLLSRLPPTSPIATTATWPVFVFGMHARDPHQKELTRAYLRDLIRIFGMGVMETALNQLEEVWTAEPGQVVASRFFTNENELLMLC
ncbi:hypothetical protein N7450_009148 [Penicillium hetheringtonii]|uniref:Zn(2)-C6 fungal-type domain-containing protein n=1 Tax=Penicillium hetheringtonii TaxID=911720 RepID=A0AAD6GQE5_9EURO|nr:hypothetical protein N7450_009148 [Penicillium hetheringtonii]